LKKHFKPDKMPQLIQKAVLFLSLILVLAGCKSQNNSIDKKDVHLARPKSKNTSSF
jgi:uncharacterized lipoprotein YajG